MVNTFAKDINTIIKGKWPDKINAVLVCKNSPKWMINIGYKDLSILMAKNHIENALGIGKKGNQHVISKEVLSNLPTLLEDPIAVFNYKGDDLLAILNAVDKNGRVVVAAIKPNGKGNYNNVEIDSNFLTSTYGRNEVVKFFDKVLCKGKIVYSKNCINKKEVLRTILKL